MMYVRAREKTGDFPISGAFPGQISALFPSLRLRQQARNKSNRTVATFAIADAEKAVKYHAKSACAPSFFFRWLHSIVE